MNKCSLCGREISSGENSFGLICLNKMRLVVNMKKVSNLKKERELDLKIQMLNWKWFLNKDARKILTNRYLTYVMIKSINLDNCKNMTGILKRDIKSINNKISKDNLESYSKIQLSEAFELYSLYNRYISLFNKTSNMTNEELRNEMQNLPWDTLMFVFSSYYEKKPYLSELIQVVQYFIWKTGVKISSDIFPNGSKYLNHSLQEKPENIYINDKEDPLIQSILNDENFKDYIEQIIEENSESSKFEVTSGLNFKSEDLFLTLNNVAIQISGIKSSSQYEMHIKITDIYDFTDLKELNEYIDDNVFKSFIGSILNNSGIASTAFNVINTYSIELEFDYEVEV